MLRIRLSRKGKKKQPSYRVVVADVDFKRDGRFVERIGWYNPLTNPSSFKIDEGRALHWLSVGAQPSDAVKRLLQKQGTYDRLPRIHKGESIDAVVAEFEGRPVEEDQPEAAQAEAAQPEAAETEAAQAENETETEDEGIVETVRETVSDTVGSVVEAAGSVVGSIVDAVTGNDDEDEADTAEQQEDAGAEEDKS